MTIEDFFNDPFGTIDDLIPDHFAFDFNGNGRADLEFRCSEGSVIPNQILLNVDSDNAADLVFKVSQQENGLPQTDLKVDLTGDENFDFSASDLNGDWWPDFVSVDSDSDGDSSKVLPTSVTGLVVNPTGFESGTESWAEIDESMREMPQDDKGNPDWFTAGEAEDDGTWTGNEIPYGLDTIPAEGTASLTFETTPQDVVDEWSSHWHKQAGDSSCAIVCQEFVLEKFLGFEIAESMLVEAAQELGVFSGSGTAFTDLGAVLNHYGVATETQFHTDIHDLEDFVNNGHGVIVGVDAHEIWGYDNWADQFGVPNAGANHAVQVIGVEEENGRKVFILNDPGTPDGQCRRVPESKFYDAWGDSECAMCVTRKAIIAC